MFKEYSGKHVLVTGGAGFIGSNLVRRLVDLGAEVDVMDDLSTGSSKNLDAGFHNFLSISINGNLKNFMKYHVSKVDFVFHLAARNIMASIKNPIDDYETNIGGTLNILMAMRESPATRMIYTSSASVYGNAKHLPINEDDLINLLTPYATSKYAGEAYCMAFHESYGVPVTALRLSNVYGPWQSPNNPYCGVVAKFMGKARKGEFMEIHGDGLSTRDFTYVDDVVNALLLAGLSPKAEGEVFNVATGIETNIKTLTSMIGHLYPAISKFDHGHMNLVPIHIDRRDIDNVRRRVLNTEKIRQRLGWISQTTLEQGLSLTKDWIERHVAR